MTANIAAIRLTLDDGTDLADKVNPRLMALTLTERRGEDSDMLELTLQNHDRQLVPPKSGVFLSLAMGWVSGNDVATGLVDKGKFKVDEIQRSGPPDIITIRARATDLTSEYKKRRDRAWNETTLGAILNDIAGQEGAGAKVHGDLAGIEISSIEQADKSNMMFVRDLGRRFDAVATWKNNLLIFMPMGSSTTSSGNAIPGRIMTRSDGWSWTFRKMDRDDYDGAEAKWRDQDSAKTKTVKTGGSKRKKLKKTYASEAAATAAAKAVAAKKGREKFSFSYSLALGDARIMANQKIELDGWDDEIDAIAWLVEEVTHSFNDKGLMTSLTMESAG